MVETSLEAIPARKLYVVPGWKYKAVVAVVTKFPTAWRLALEKSAPHRKNQ